ncbi:hypothetical protein LTR66_015870 [Elasticomyces elasticus]|nr:hypothetical protein LTR66_015870 [Elasticomyces elasticus]
MSYTSLNISALEAVAVNIVRVTTNLLVPDTSKRLHLAHVLIDVATKNFSIIEPVFDGYIKRLQRQNATLLNGLLGGPAYSELVNGSHDHPSFASFNDRIPTKVLAVFGDTDRGRQFLFNLTQIKIMLDVGGVASREDGRTKKMHRKRLELDLGLAVGLDAEDIEWLAQEETQAIEGERTEWVKMVEAAHASKIQGAVCSDA